MMWVCLAVRCPTSMLLSPNTLGSAGKRCATWPGARYESSLDPRRIKNDYDTLCGQSRCHLPKVSVQGGKPVCNHLRSDRLQLRQSCASFMSTRHFWSSVKIQLHGTLLIITGPNNRGIAISRQS
jgi:hypothetical protein